MSLPDPRAKDPQGALALLAMRGACVSEDPRLFDWDEDSIAPDGGARAMEICATCPVRVQCLSHAREYETAGIWAGTFPDERMGSGRQSDIAEGIAAAELDYKLRIVSTRVIAEEYGVSRRTVFRWKLQRSAASAEDGEPDA